MIIEFRTCGDGTNVEVSLIDDLGVRDRIYTADHAGGIHYGEERGVPIKALQIFQWIEQSWARPIIGGRYSASHLYWAEREEKRKANEK
jgi:hypothetical protein